jgi:branched-chain amino acid transport system ATP-binding protein
MTEPILEVRGVTKRFGGLVAIRDVDLTIRRGEIVGIIGPNGAGKTTLVNCVSGLDKPTAGRIVWKGRDITRTAGHRIGRMGIARTFQVVKPLKQLTVRDNVAIGAMFGRGGAGRSTGAARAAADGILDRVGLARRSAQRASELTIADLKRLELAKALAMEPELLFLDEVMAGLNQTEVEQAMALVQDIHAGGVTVVFIEHVMKVVMRMSQRVIVLHHARLIADGPPGEIIERPEVIEAYLGERFAKRGRPVPP